MGMWQNCSMGIWPLAADASIYLRHHLVDSRCVIRETHTYPSPPNQCCHKQKKEENILNGRCTVDFNNILSSSIVDGYRRTDSKC